MKASIRRLNPRINRGQSLWHALMAVILALLSVLFLVVYANAEEAASAAPLAPWAGGDLADTKLILIIIVNAVVSAGGLGFEWIYIRGLTRDLAQARTRIDQLDHDLEKTDRLLQATLARATT